MKTGRNIITTDEYRRIHFPDATAKNIWMSTNELMELFGVISPTLRANITAIYKNGILDECEVQRCINLSNGISIDVCTLPMIVALSFRLNTLGAYKVRECVVNKLTVNLRNQILFKNVRTHEYTHSLPIISFINHEVNFWTCVFLNTARRLLSRSKYFRMLKRLVSFRTQQGCFQPLEINGAASNLMFVGTWQVMF